MHTHCIDREVTYDEEEEAGESDADDDDDAEGEGAGGAGAGAGAGAGGDDASTEPITVPIKGCNRKYARAKGAACPTCTECRRKLCAHLRHIGVVLCAARGSSELVVDPKLRAKVNRIGKKARFRNAGDAQRTLEILYHRAKLVLEEADAAYDAENDQQWRDRKPDAVVFLTREEYDAAVAAQANAAAGDGDAAMPQH